VVVELETSDPDGQRSIRQVPAQDCAEAVRASAWILTLLVDPAAAAASENEPIAAAPATGNEVARPAEAAAPARAQTAASVSAGKAMETLDSPPSAPAARERTWQIGVGAFAGALQTALPETPIGFGGFVEWAWESGGWFRPSARLAGLDAGSGVAHSEWGDVVVSFVGGRLSLCPLRTSRARPLSTRFCALGELGRLTGKGQATTEQQSATPTWSAAGVAFAVELQPWPFLAFELEAAMIFPFNRDRFVFEPEPGLVHVGYEVPPISGSFALGAAWQL